MNINIKHFSQLYRLYSSKFPKNHYRQCSKILNFQQVRGKRDSSKLSSLFTPVPVKSSSDDINVGYELSGKLNKADLLKILNKFYQKKEIKYLAIDSGLDSKYT